MLINIYAAWGGILAGCLSGAITGLFFHAEDWLGGYASWRRRMIRLGHISFFGIAFLNLAFALTCQSLGLNSGLAIPSGLLLVGAVTMPLVCYLSAWKPPFRHIFFIPAGSLTLAVVVFILKLHF